MDKGIFVEDENIKEIASQIALQAMVVVTNEELSPFAPQEMNVANDGRTLIIKWQDDVEHVLTSFHVRGMCPCAHCVDEITGEKLIKDEDIPANVKILESTPVGTPVLGPMQESTPSHTFANLVRKPLRRPPSKFSR